MSKPVKGVEAHSLGLVDALVAPDQIVNTACQWALDILECRRPWVCSLYKTDKLESLGEAREILKFARTQTRKRAPNLTHPLVCIDVIEAGIVSGPVAGLWKVCTATLFCFLHRSLLTCYCVMGVWYLQEAEAFQELLRADTCKALVHIFFAQRGTSKVKMKLKC